MLDDYLELNTQNKLNLIIALYNHRTATQKMISNMLSLSFRGISSLIETVNIEIQDLGKILKSDSGISLILEQNTTFFQLFRAVSSHSTTLLCLKFLLLNDTNIPFRDFASEVYLTKSSAYRIRERCCTYLDSIGLKVVNNRVVGEEYRIRFLIALLHYKYGVSCYEFDENSLQSVRRFILSTNQSIQLCYLEHAEMEYGFFEYLVVLAWKRASYPLSSFSSTQLQTLKSIFAYEKMKKALKATLEPDLNIDFTEIDYEYLYLVYCSTNSCMFSDQWSAAEILHVHEIVFSDPAFADLLRRLERLFPAEMIQSRALRTVLIYFYKKCLLELQCIIPDKNFFIDREIKPLTNSVFERLTALLSEWQHHNGLAHPIEHEHVLYLSLQLEFILRQFIPPATMYILYDLNSELQIMLLYLKRMYSFYRIQPVPILLNAQSKEITPPLDHAIILVNRKFTHVLPCLGIQSKHTIVPVSVELTDKEASLIEQAITNYEEAQFFKFINQN